MRRTPVDACADSPPAAARASGGVADSPPAAARGSGEVADSPPAAARASTAVAERPLAKARGPARVAELAGLLALLAVAGWLRLADLDRFIASDELRWTCRSINFQTALRQGSWEDTFQVGHPGVLTMWLGSVALESAEVGRWRDLCRETDGGRDLSSLDDVGMEGILQSAAPLLFQARTGIAVATVVLLAVVYGILRTGLLLGPVPSLAGLALLSLDPFLVAHSRVLHLDALTALLSLASVGALATVGGRRRLTRWAPAWLAASGALAGLAAVNKVPAVLLAPFALIWMGGQARRAGGWRRAAGRFGLWLACAVAAYAAVWPAMWVDPVGTLRAVLSKAVLEGGQPHASGNFFMGAPVSDPGPLFYPVAALFRLSPWALLGVILAVGMMLARARHHWPALGPREVDDEDAAAGRALAALLTWALVFGVALTLGPKKFDRYLLPSLVAVNLAAGLAIGALAGRDSIRARLPRPRWRWGVGGLVVVVLAVAQGAAAVRWHPYQLAYYNPLLGGAAAAQRVLLVGWGEGYDLAAGWLNGLPGAATLEASVRGVSNFAPLFKGRTRSAPGYRPGRTDYVVFYINQVQRRRNESLLNAYLGPGGAAPVHVGRIAGIEYVWVYENPQPAALRRAISKLASPGDVLVAGGETVFARRYSGPLTLVRYWGHWGAAEMEEALRVAFPVDWERAWVIRYPDEDPTAPLDTLARVADRGATHILDAGLVEVTEFRRRP